MIITIKTVPHLVSPSSFRWTKFRQQNPVLCVSVDILYLLYYLTKTLLTLHPYFYLFDYAEFRQPDPKRKKCFLSAFILAYVTDRQMLNYARLMKPSAKSLCALRIDFKVVLIHRQPDPIFCLSLHPRLRHGSPNACRHVRRCFGFCFYVVDIPTGVFCFNVTDHHMPIDISTAKSSQNPKP